MLLAAVAVVTAAAVIAPSHAISSSHNELRSYICKASKGQDARCDVEIRRSETAKEFESKPAGAGCFKETANANKTRVYCPLYCETATAAFAMSKKPVGKNKCFNHINYEVEKRDKDWFLWRSEDCLKSDILFEIGCWFDFIDEKPDEKKSDLAKKDHPKKLRI